MPAVVDLTDECAEFVRSEGDGLLHVFVPHATAGLAIIETGSGSDDDLLAQLDELLPRDDRWRHRHGSPGPRPRPRAARRSCRRTPASRAGGAAAAGHLAADLPGRHQHRQPATARPVLLPRRLTDAAVRPVRGPVPGHGRMEAMTADRRRPRPPGPRRPGAGLHAARRRRQPRLARRPPRPAGDRLLLPGRAHPGLHHPGRRLHRRRRRPRRGRAGHHRHLPRRAREAHALPREGAPGHHAGLRPGQDGAAPPTAPTARRSCTARRSSGSSGRPSSSTPRAGSSRPPTTSRRPVTWPSSAANWAWAERSHTALICRDADHSPGGPVPARCAP